MLIFCHRIDSPDPLILSSLYRALGVGRLGVLPLAIHTVPTQVVTLCFLVPESIGIALSTRLGTLLPQDVRLAQQLVIWSFVVCSIIFGIMSYSLYAFRGTIIRLIVSDEDVIEGCERIWWKVSLNFFLWCVYGLNEGVAVALGLQWTLGWLTIVVLWMFGLPCAWYFGIIRYQSIDVVWSWLIVPYACIDVALIVSFLLQDWNKISEEIREREEMEESSSDEESEPEDENGRSLYGAVDTADLLGDNGKA
jgi:multidrug resistance protein, MATE family